MLIFVQFFLAGLPWFLGALTGLAVYLSIRPQIRPAAAIQSISVGGYFGLLVFPGILWMLDQFALPVFSTTLVCILLAALVACGYFCSLSLLHRKDVQRPSLPVVKLLLAIVCCMALPALYHAYLPVVGWDVIDHWARVAGLFIAHTADLSVEPFSYPNKHHPLTLQILAAWSGWLGPKLGTSTLALAPWLYFQLSALLVTGAFTWAQTGSSKLMVISLMLITTLPILEQHAIAPGYAMIPMMTGFLLALTQLYQCFEKPQIMTAIGGLSLALSLTLLKNNGGLFTASLLTSALLTYLYCKSRFVLGLALVLGALSTTLMAKLDLVIDFKNGERLGYDSHFQTLYLAGKGLTLRDSSSAEITLNLLHAIVMNSSFSISILLLVIAIFTLHEGRASLLFLVLNCVVVLATAALGQLTEYGYGISVAGSDTGLSRFIVPTMASVALLAPLLAKLVSSKQRHA